MSIGILILRLVLGLSLAAHGAQKLFGWFGGPGLGPTGAFFEQIGFRPGRRNALLAGLSETVGGLFIALGLATPIAATMILAVMLVAIVSVHLRNGFFIQNQGYEHTLTFALAALSLAFTGPGPISLDTVLGLHLSGTQWGLATLLLGLAGATARLAARKFPPQVSDAEPASR